MTTAIYYFTRTGTSEKIAKMLAESKNANFYKIEDNISWKGILGFIKGGYYSTKKKSIPASYQKPQADDQIVLVMPLWAGTFPPAVRAFIEEISRERITLVVTSSSSKLQDRMGFVKVIDAIGKNPTVTL